MKKPIKQQRTIGQVSAEITKEIIRFEREHLGRGPKDAKTYILGDIIFVRLKGVLTPAEKQLAESQAGGALVKEIRHQLLESSRSLLEEIIEKVTNCQILSVHTDISTKTGERIIVFVLKENLEERFKKV